MVKITQLEVENLKRIKACTISPAESGLTVIGGRNGQGKTSTLDAITWALGGESYRPSNPTREGSTLPPSIRVALSNGVIVERKGKNSALKVTDPTGKRSGQQLLNALIGHMAIDLPAFMQGSAKDKAKTLLQIIGVGDQLNALDREEAEKYAQRRSVGQIADQKAKFAQELPSFPGLPEEPVSAAELIRQQQEILARNGENQRKRQHAAELEAQAKQLSDQVHSLEAQLFDTKARLTAALEDARIASTDAGTLTDQSTAELEQNLAQLDELNRKIRANLDRDKALEDAEAHSRAYEGLTAEISNLRAQRTALLNSCKMPLDGLSVENGELTYHGQRWDCMSSAEQLMVGTAIARAVNPACGFVLLDKLEQMDRDTLQEFGEWLEQENLQVIATRVSTGDECAILIEDGYSTVPWGLTAPEPATPETQAWTPGVF